MFDCVLLLFQCPEAVFTEEISFLFFLFLCRKSVNEKEKKNNEKGACEGGEREGGELEKEGKRGKKGQELTAG